MDALSAQVLGCDFSSSPSRRKPVVVALGQLQGDVVRLDGFERFTDLDEWARWLAADGGWTGGFDLPFGLPRELVQQLGWPQDWRACMQHYAGLSRAEIRDTFAAFCQRRPAGGKFAHRATDGPAGSSPSMKWVNPPVAFMLHAGVPRLLRAGLHLPGLNVTDSPKVGLEAYPGLLARAIVGRASYKSDDATRQTAERAGARQRIVQAVLDGAHPLQLALLTKPVQQALLVDDASGDHLDAVLCMLQAAWALRRRLAGDVLYGLPAGMDPLEGWIVSAPWPPGAR
ncbi:MAG: DUF429 domain-containing protein [Comamonas sp.]